MANSELTAYKKMLPLCDQGLHPLAHCNAGPHRPLGMSSQLAAAAALKCGTEQVAAWGFAFKLELLGSGLKAQLPGA